MSHNRLINGFTTDQQDHGVVIGFHAELAACPIQHHQLPFTCHALAIDQYGALQNHQRSRPALWAFQLGNPTLIQTQIPYIHGSEGLGRACGTVLFSGNHTHHASGIGQSDYRNLLVGNGLIASGSALIFGRQVDPQLHHFQGATRAGKGVGVVLLVQNARTGCHPLHITGTNRAALARGVVVRHLALVDDGDGFKTTVWVLANAAFVIARGKLGRAGIVQQQERAQLFCVCVVRKQGANGEAVAHPVRTGSAIDTKNFLHVHLLVST